MSTFSLLFLFKLFNLDDFHKCRKMLVFVCMDFFQNKYLFGSLKNINFLLVKRNIVNYLAYSLNLEVGKSQVKGLGNH